MDTTPQQFKIAFRHAYQAYELQVQLISIDAKKELWRIWNNAIDVTMESDRPGLQSRPGFRHWLPQWKIVKGELKPPSLANSIIDSINKEVEGKKKR